MKNTPTYAEFAAELGRRFRAIKFEGQFAPAQMAGVFTCLIELIRLQQEIGAGIRKRMIAAIEDMDAMAAEKDDDQPTDEEIADSDAADWESFRRECGYRNV